jgi:Cof subfamily protein (haloacid dehalogenase superfamily)
MILTLMPYRLLALDVDGTLVDPEGALRPMVREAVHAARERGVQVVLCTGRRFRTARGVLDELDLDGAVVIHNGVVVKDIRSGETVEHRYLSLDLYSAILEVMREVGPPLVYVDHYHDDLDIYAEPPERAHAFQAEYLADAAPVTRFIDSLDEPPSPALVMLSAMADESRLLPLREAIEDELGSHVRTNFIANQRYRGHILEVVSRGSGKWSALRALAERQGIAPGEIVAIGDDYNDVEMIAEAGLGVAMGNAVAAAKEAADLVTGSNAEDGVVRVIEEFLLAG